MRQNHGFPYYESFITNDNGSPSTRLAFSFQQGISASSMTDNVTSIPAKLFHLKMIFTDAGQLPMVAFEDNETQPPGVANCRDQFYTACGPFTGGLTFDDCATFPGTQFVDATFDSGGATLSSTNNEFFSGLLVYPNPTEEVLYVDINKKSDYSIIDIFGKVIKTGMVQEGKNELDLKNYQAGIYFLKINNDSGSVTKKVMKK